MTERDSVVPPGWNRAKPERLPKLTAAPALFAFGVTLFGWGLVSSFLLSLIGGVTLAFALAHWIGEIRNDSN